MKKLIAMMLALALVLTLAACGGDDSAADDMVITRDPQNSADVPAQDAPAAVEDEAGEPYVFEADGVKLVPGTAFDPSVLPPAVSVYEVPSCAIEGTDNVYNYDTFEITAYDDGTGEVIYSIYFIDPNLTTPEGLALGDDVARMEELYGVDHTQEGTAFIYTAEGTMLSIIVQNDTVNSIEYRMIVE